MKKVLVVLFALVLVVSLAACGSSDNESSGSASQPQQAVHENRLVLIPDVEDNSTVNSDQLNVIKSYLEALAGDKAAVTVDEGNKQVFVEMANGIPDGADIELTAKPRLTIRDSYDVVLMDGSDVLSANAVVDGSDSMVEIQFTEKGKDKFASITKAYINRQIAVYLDDQMLTNPTILFEITSGKVQIAGAYSAEEVVDLATKISYAILPFDVKAVRG